MARHDQSNFINIVYIFTAFIVCACADTPEDAPFLWSSDDDLDLDKQLTSRRGCCNTPDGPGNCVSVLNCEQIVTFLNRAHKPFSPHTLKVLQKYQCASVKTDPIMPKVCCPYGPVSTPPPPHPNVSQHRNINLLPSDCGHLDMDADEVIQGGLEASLFEFPWMALLLYSSKKGQPQFKCVGTILNDKYILTVAHCITDLRFPLLGVRIGEHDLRSTIDCERILDEQFCAPPVQDLPIEELIPHSQYRNCSNLHDIGLIRVQGRMNLSVENARPVCLPVMPMPNYSFNERNMIAAGWGGTLETGRFKAGRYSKDVLLRGVITAISNKKCSKLYRDYFPIQYRQLCGRIANVTIACLSSGTSIHDMSLLNGSIKMVQQGISSFGPKGCRHDGLPEVYTRTAYYLDWILDSIRA